MTLNLKKGDAPLSLKKSPKESDGWIKVRVMWPSLTDYDLGAEILYTDGTSESLSMFWAHKTGPLQLSRGGYVQHLGDARRGSGEMAEEVIHIHGTAAREVAAIAPWAYSAQSNGGGSFRRYQVSMEVTTLTDSVRIDAVNASDNDSIYTCVPALIVFPLGATDEVRIDPVEMYSRPGSENRPRLYDGSEHSALARFRKASSPGVVVPKLSMDDGPKNRYKN